MESIHDDLNGKWRGKEVAVSISGTLQISLTPLVSAKKHKQAILFAEPSVVVIERGDVGIREMLLQKRRLNSAALKMSSDAVLLILRFFGLEKKGG